MSGTRGIIGSSSFSQSIGVRQGGSLSCPLFTFYIDETIKAVNQAPDDGWLGKIHTLLLMDDTVIFSTSRESMEMKLRLLKDATDSLGMSMHPSKSKFMAVNADDTQHFSIDGVIIEHQAEYIYLGTPILNTTVAQQVKRHIELKNSHLLKFFSFLSKNSDAPFKVKDKVRQSALNAAILYGCETWLCDNVRPAETAYMAALKHQLGVRTTTHNQLTCIEAGVSDAKSFIKDRQCNFIRKLQQSSVYEDTLLHSVMEMAKRENSPMAKYIGKLDLQINYSQMWMSDAKNSVRTSTNTRPITYTAINPVLEPCQIYTAVNIPEYARISCTRIRLSSHRLRIETGRWSRTPREERKCTCGVHIQTEEHVLLSCRETSHIRQLYPQAAMCTSIAELFSPEDNTNWKAVCLLCHKTLCHFN